MGRVSKISEVRSSDGHTIVEPADLTDSNRFAVHSRAGPKVPRKRRDDNALGRLVRAVQCGRGFTVHARVVVPLRNRGSDSSCCPRRRGGGGNAGTRDVACGRGEEPTRWRRRRNRDRSTRAPAAVDRFPSETVFAFGVPVALAAAKKKNADQCNVSSIFFQGTCGCAPGIWSSWETWALKNTTTLNNMAGYIPPHCVFSDIFFIMVFILNYVLVRKPCLENDPTSAAHYTISSKGRPLFLNKFPGKLNIKQIPTRIQL